MVSFLRSTSLLFSAGGGGDPAQGLLSFMPLIVIFAIFYFLLIRPQQKKQQQHKEMLNNLKRGDRVITTGGIYGTIEGFTDDGIQLKIASQVKIKVARNAIAGLQKGEPTAEE